MSDEFSNRPEEASSDCSIERRSSGSFGSGSRPDGERGEGMVADRQIASNSDGQLSQDDVLEAELVEQVREQVVHQLMSVTRIAPLPEPRELQEYENIESGLANRIVAMAENAAEAANVATRSNAAVNNAIADSIREDGRSVARGQWIFTVLAISFLAVAVCMVFFDKTSFATGMGILGFLSLCGVLVRPVNASRWRSSAREENESMGQE